MVGSLRVTKIAGYRATAARFLSIFNDNEHFKPVKESYSWNLWTQYQLHTLTTFSVTDRHRFLPQNVWESVAHLEWQCLCLLFC